MPIIDGPGDRILAERRAKADRRLIIIISGIVGAVIVAGLAAIAYNYDADEHLIARAVACAQLQGRAQDLTKRSPESS